MKLGKVFFQNIHNRPSGGGKDIHQTANLFREQGFEAYVFSPAKEVYWPRWLLRPVPVISNEQAVAICRENDLVVGGWPDKETTVIIRGLTAKIKVFWPQCSFFIKSKTMLGDAVFKPEWGYTHFWAMCESNKKILDKAYGINSHIIHHYFDKATIGPFKNPPAKKRQILCLPRRGDRFITLAKLFFKNQIPFVTLKEPFGEAEFYKAAAESRFFLSTQIGLEPKRWRNFKQLIKYYLTGGRKGDKIKVIQASGGPIEAMALPPAEAACLDAIPIGFDGERGQSEWMRDDNSFLAADGSYLELLKAVKSALQTPEERLKVMAERGGELLAKYTEEFVWSEIKNFLQKSRLLD